MADHAFAAPAEAQLRECRDCGQFQRLPALRPNVAAHCIRCRAVLRRSRADPLRRPLALALAGIALYALALFSPFMGFRLIGFSRQTTLLSGPEALEAQGMWGLGTVVFATVVLMPLTKLLVIAAVLGGLRLRRPPRLLALLFRWYERIGPWAMIEVFLLGVLVAWSRLSQFATVDLGPAIVALGGLMLVMVAADASMDADAVWEALWQRGARAARDPPVRGDGAAIGCDVCGLVSRAAAEGTAWCPRCGARLRRRRPNSLVRTWALLIASAILYLPANLLPVMTVIYFARGAPTTILGGVEELASRGLWPLAAIVFIASIMIPALKLVGLVLMLVSVQRRWTGRLRDRTRLYRIVDAVGRWSMIDVFMLSVLVALVRLGFIASVEPGTGAACFAAVVVLTMFATASFDPRLMWDAAARPAPSGVPGAPAPAPGHGA